MISISRQISNDWPETKWDRVLALRDPAARDEALREVCEMYRGVILAICRRWNEQEADDLAHGFFLWVIKSRKFELADPKRGRFRSYLSTMLRNFLRKDYRTTQTQRRGGTIDHLEADEDLLGHFSTDDAAFDHVWAMAVMNRVITTLEAEAAKSGIKSEVLRRMVPFLQVQDDQNFCRKKLAAELGRPAGTVRADVSNLTRRFRELLEREISATTSASDLEAEIRHLMRALVVKS